MFFFGSSFVLIALKDLACNFAVKDVYLIWDRISVSAAFQGCTASDDKTASVEDFLRYLYGAMAHDAIWQYASEEQLQDAQMAIERSVMNRIFKLAFSPNQDGDIMRDEWGTSEILLHLYSYVVF